MYLTPETDNTFAQVYSVESKKMVRLATMVLGSQSVAEEAVQDAFLQLHTNWFQVDNPGAFVRVAVLNRCRDLRRRRKVSQRHLRLLEPEHEATKPNHYLVDALQSIAYQRRTILVLRFYGDYKLKEIAEMMDLPEGTVNSNLRRGIKELKEALSQ